MIGRRFGRFGRRIGRCGSLEILAENAVDLDAEAREEDRDDTGCRIETGSEYRDYDPDTLDTESARIAEAHHLRGLVAVFHDCDFLHRERHQEEIKEGDAASADTAEEYLIIERNLIRYDIMKYGKNDEHQRHSDGGDDQYVSSFFFNCGLKHVDPASGIRLDLELTEREELWMPV